ncbi:MAG: protein-tyrosine-phosphatase [Cytophagales bacterium]|nr:protein-tyrosine-phosphatase [Cytophagales bacterium]
MYSSIKNHISTFVNNFGSIPEHRKILLQKLSEYICIQINSKKAAHLLYVCTHNSRRSHMGQIWGKVASEYYGIHHINTYSGGTETTAFHPNAISALREIGFDISRQNDIPNPHYEVRYSDTEPAIICYSKIYDVPENPKSDFCAIMTCSEADANCPFIPGASARISTTYEDPKLYDGTPVQAKAYLDRCAQIATETLYAFSLV